MGLLQARQEPQKLKRFSMLSKRLALSEEQLQRLKHLKRGLTGELAVDTLVAPLDDGVLLAVPDLSFTVNNQSVQIDLLLLTGGRLVVLEVKNYSGDYEIRDGEWLSPHGNVVKNPLLQLERTVTLLKQYLRTLGLSGIHVEGLLVFPNPDFWLYGAAKGDPILLLTQFERFLNALGKGKTPDIRQEHKRLMDTLISHQDQGMSSRFTEKVDYSFDSIRKGVYCPRCDQHMHRQNQRTFRCPACGHVLSTGEMVQQTIQEFSLLFPDMAVTVKHLHHFSGAFLSARLLRSYLSKHYSLDDIKKRRNKGYIV